MRPGTTYWHLAALAAVAVALPAAAQTRDSTAAERRDAAVILDHTFTSAIGEPIHVFLAKDVTYHADMQGLGLTLQLKPLLSSTQLPLIEPLLAGQSAGGSSLYIIKPRADAEYIFTTTGGDVTAPVHLRVSAVPAKDKKP